MIKIVPFIYAQINTSMCPAPNTNIKIFSVAIKFFYTNHSRCTRSCNTKLYTTIDEQHTNKSQDSNNFSAGMIDPYLPLGEVVEYPKNHFQ